MARDDKDRSDTPDKVIEESKPMARVIRPDSPWPIDPYVESGIFLAKHLNELVAALDSTNFGATRPSYAVVGTMWCKQEPSGKFSLYIYNGNKDLLVSDSDGIGLEEIDLTALTNYLQTNLDFGVTKFGPALNKRDGDVTPMEGDYKLGQMEDVFISSAKNDHALVYEDAQWKNLPVVNSFNGQTGDITPQEGDYSLAMLSDTDVDVVSDRQVLGYKNGASEPWQPLWAVMKFNGRSGPDILPEEADYKLEMLGDVALASLTKNDMLQFNGTSWENNPPKLIDTELQFAGPIDPTVTAPAAQHAWIYISNKNGNAHPSFSGLDGQYVRVGNALGYSTNHNTNGDWVGEGNGGAWFLLGDVFQGGVVSIGQGQGIKVDSSTPSSPVVSVNRTTVDAWYAAFNHLHTGVYEPVIGAKGTAFNKNFGTSAGQVAEGNHLHTGVYSPLGHTHDGEFATFDHRHDDLYEPKFTKRTGFNKNFGLTKGTVAEGDHGHNGYAITGHTHSEYAALNHPHNEYEPKIKTKYSAFNQNFGTGYNDCARGDHDHGDLPIGPHTHAFSDISGGTSRGSTGFTFNSSITAKFGIAVTGGALTSASYISTTGYISAGTDLRAGGDVIAYYSSDERLKDKIRPIENALNKVCQIRGIEFEWNDNQEAYEGEDVGVSAQSVRAVFPSLVQEREADGYLGVRYEKLVGPLVAAVSELRDMVSQLQAEVEELKRGKN